MTWHIATSDKQKRSFQNLLNTNEKFGLSSQLGFAPFLQVIENLNFMHKLLVLIRMNLGYLQ